MHTDVSRDASWTPCFPSPASRKIRSLGKRELHRRFRSYPRILGSPHETKNDSSAPSVVEKPLFWSYPPFECLC